MSLIMTHYIYVEDEDIEDDDNFDVTYLSKDDNNLDVSDDEHTWSAPLESRAPRPCCKCGTSSRPPP